MKSDYLVYAISAVTLFVFFMSCTITSLFLRESPVCLFAQFLTLILVIVFTLFLFNKESSLKFGRRERADMERLKKITYWLLVVASITFIVSLIVRVMISVL